MKKIALTSLIAMFAFAGAHAANVIDGNPLYMPKKGHFYSVTELETSTRNVDAQTLGEEFGYGITDRLAIALETSLGQADWFEFGQWNALGLDLTYRFADYKNWKWDVIGGYGVGPVWGAGTGKHQFFHGHFLDKDETQYFWTVGVRGGYTAGDFTLAGHVMMDYENTKSFNWDQKENSWHTLRAGLDGQLVLNNRWNLIAGAEYSKSMDHYNETPGAWELEFGANYNIDATKFVGAYITKDVVHTKAPAEGTWDILDGFGMGVRFGIDF